MKLCKYKLFFLGLILIQFQTIAQQDYENLVQFSGVIVEKDSLQAVPYVNIIIQGTKRGTTSDYYGFFSFVAYKGDVVEFSAVGYKKSFYRIPDTLSANRYSLIHVLTTDTLLLKETIIYPWPTLEMFKMAFLKLDIPDDDLERAKKNLARAELKDRMQELPMDGSYAFKQYIDKQVYSHGYMGMQPKSLTNMVNNPLLNPFAWAEFIKAWKRGDFKRKDD